MKKPVGMHKKTRRQSTTNPYALQDQAGKIQGVYPTEKIATYSRPHPNCLCLCHRTATFGLWHHQHWPTFCPSTIKLCIIHKKYLFRKKRWQMSEKKCTFEKCNRGQDIMFSVHYKLYTINQNKIENDKYSIIWSTGSR